MIGVIMRARVVHLVAVSLVSLAVACAAEGGGDPPAADTGGSTGAVATSDASPTTGDAGDETGTAAVGPYFYDDILPVVIENCAGCHTEGGIGPFDLRDYDTTSALAEAIAVLTAERTMPPFNANNEGICNTYASARWLDDAEIQLFSDWAAAGAPMGDPDAPQPEPTPLPTLAGADVTEHDTPAGYVPQNDGSGSNGLDDYQCFLAELDVGDTTRYVTGYDVIPGNPALTHHLVGFLVDLEAPSGLFGTNGEAIALLDEGSPDQPGWDCYGGAGNGIIPLGFPVTWAPGAGALNLPEGTGIPIEPGQALVLQMHYNLANGEGEDSTTLRLAWADQVQREAINTGQDQFLAAGFGGAIEIPPGEESFVYTWDMPLWELESRTLEWDQVEILGILPHMHEIGQRMQIDILSEANPAEESCAMFVDRWDFDWQQTFMYETPLVVSAGDTIRVTCEWNSSERDAPTTPGLGSQNEMCAIGVFVAPAQ